MSLRDKYMSREIDFHGYYGALVELLGESSLRQALPGQRKPAMWRALIEQDEHLNNVPLAYWDAGDGFVRLLVSYVSRPALEAITGTGGWSLSNSVCVLKEAARRYAQEGDA